MASKNPSSSAVNIEALVDTLFDVLKLTLSTAKATPLSVSEQSVLCMEVYHERFCFFYFYYHDIVCQFRFSSILH